MRKIYGRACKEKSVQLNCERQNISEIAIEVSIPAPQFYNQRKEQEELWQGNFRGNENVKQI